MVSFVYCATYSSGLQQALPLDFSTVSTDKTLRTIPLYEILSKNLKGPYSYQQLISNGLLVDVKDDKCRHNYVDYRGPAYNFWALDQIDRDNLVFSLCQTPHLLLVFCQQIVKGQLEISPSSVLVIF